ncbi:hypothetical protein PUN28_020893 [Cardiocondyla obscurior]|uniref:Uncharacterized protein n=1 Tax=Cardiocondyla obscurior TaxID=286306 RepID=A0AAW2E7G3_9HYME
MFVVKFQKYFFSFIGHISAAGENRRFGIGPYASPLSAAQCYVAKFQKYFISFFGHISASGENRRLAIGSYALFLIVAQCYVVKFQKYFLSFFGHISASARNRPECIYFECRTMLCCKTLKTFFFVFWPYLGSGENRRLGISPYASPLSAAQCYLGIRPNASILNAAQCYVVKFQKYFFSFIGHISAAGENRRFGIGPYASLLSAAQCYVAKFQKYFISFFGHISASGENRRLGIGSYALFLIVAQCYVALMHPFLMPHNAMLLNFNNIFFRSLAISRLLVKIEGSE